MKVDIAIHVRKVRKAKGLTIEELSRLSGVSVAYISEIETGKYNFTIQVLCRLALALDVSATELITYTEKK